MGKKPNKSSGGNTYWLYGKHSVLAALKNTNREVFELIITSKNEDLIKSSKTKYRIATTQEISGLLKQDDVVHQGIAARVAELRQPHLHDILSKVKESKSSIIILLDQITDPHNVGAIIRTSAAFGVDAIVTTKHNSPSENGALAKASSGMVENINLVTVTNLNNAIDELKKAGFWVVGMDGHAKNNLSDAKQFDKVALVMGAEGKGIRRLTLESCDLTVKIPMSKDVESLNVSNAAAIALYELSKD